MSGKFLAGVTLIVRMADLLINQIMNERQNMKSFTIIHE